MPFGAQRWLVPLFFCGLFLTGVLLHRDYGVSWDEPTDHLNGLVSIKYVASLLMPERVKQQPTAREIPDFANYQDNDHGVIFEVPLSIISYLFVHQNQQAYFFLRHFLIFGVFQLGVWSVFRIGKEWLGDWRWALLAALLLVLSPRIFAEAFYNGKDVLFLGLFAFGMSTLVRFTTKPTTARAIGHGLATALAIDARIPGALLLAFTLVVVGLDLIQRTSPERSARLRLLGIYLAVAVVLTVAGWPYLWANPIGNFAAAWRSMGHYEWGNTNLYLGHYYRENALPWHYAPVWILITTPVPYTVGALLGLGTIAWKLGQPTFLLARLRSQRLDLLVAGWLLGPLLLVIVFNSSLYDTWRHLYFVYPALVLLAARGAQALAPAVRQYGSKLRPVAVAVLLLGTLETGRTLVRMVRMHPFQFMYFSFLPAPVAEQLFERDYWGLSARRGLEWLTRHPPTGPLRVYTVWPMSSPVYNNSQVLPPEQRQRIQYIGNGSADYFFTAYRWYPQSLPADAGAEIYRLEVEGIRTLSIFRKRPTP